MEITSEHQRRTSDAVTNVNLWLMNPSSGPTSGIRLDGAVQSGVSRSIRAFVRDKEALTIDGYELAHRPG
jgi:hypothetical protein